MKICAAPGCEETFEPITHNQKYHSQQCKRNAENYSRRREPSFTVSEGGPQWPVIQTGPPIKISAPKKKPRKLQDNWQHAVILPDVQIGFYRDLANELHPTHDEAALSVALQIVSDVQPDVVVIIGDTIDLPELGRFRYSPPFAQTTQASIDRLTIWLAEIRAAASDAEIVYLAGNHEERLPNYLMDNAMASFGIKRGASPPEDWPVLSIPFLCRLEEVGVEFFPGYPANVYWLNDRLRVIHGVRVCSTGSTVHRYLNDERVSTIVGHIHRREWGERTRATRRGARTILAASPGCLCRVDGKVPSTKAGIDLNGVPMTSYEDWQQGLAVVRYQEGDGPFLYEPISIFDGWAAWRDKEYTSEF